MIPKYQRILFWTLASCSLIMILFLLRGCEQAHHRLTSHEDEAPLVGQGPSSTQTVTFALADDSDGSITPTERQVDLPEESSIHARLLLEALMAQYSQPGSHHPLPGGQAIDDLFLLTIPSAQESIGPAITVPPNHLGSLFNARPGAQVAVVNLHGNFVDHHPSGVLVEQLTLDSLLGTIHNALPQVEQVRFLVDGHPRETLAGHAGLLRAYPAADAANRASMSEGR